MEFNLDLLQLLLVVLLGSGGVEGTKQGIKYLRKKSINNNLPNEFDDLQGTNPGFNPNMPRSECQLKHLNLTEQMKKMNESMLELHRDMKSLLGMQISMSSLEGKFSTEVEKLRGEIPREVRRQVDRHEDKHHKAV